MGMPSVHGFGSIALAVKVKNPQTAVFWLPLFVAVVAHRVFDWLPHLEPGLLGLEHNKLFSLGFWWTLLDIVGITVLTHKASVNFPDRKLLLWLCWGGALGPDVLTAVFSASFMPKTSWMLSYLDDHHAVHAWWADAWPSSMSAYVGTVISLLLVLLSGLLYLQEQPPKAESQETIEEESRIATTA